MNYLTQRIRELLNLIYALRDEANEDTQIAKELLEKFKETKDNDEKVEYTKAFKKVEFFNNIKLSDIDKHIPILLELVSVAKVLDVETGLTEEEAKMLDLSKVRFAPFFILSKGKLEILNKDLETVIVNELNNPSENDLKAIEKISKVLNNG